MSQSVAPDPRVMMAADAMGKIAWYLGAVLSAVPGESRAVARALFIDMVDQAVADQLSGPSNGAIRHGR